MVNRMRERGRSQELRGGRSTTLCQEPRHSSEPQRPDPCVASDDRTEVGQETEEESRASRRWTEADRERSGATADNEEDTRQHCQQQVQSCLDSEAVNPQLLPARCRSTRKSGKSCIA